MNENVVLVPKVHISLCFVSVFNLRPSFDYAEADGGYKMYYAQWLCFTLIVELRK